MARAAASTMRSCVSSFDLPVTRFIWRLSYYISARRVSGICAARLLPLSPLGIVELRLKCIECGSEMVNIDHSVFGNELDQSRSHVVARQPVPTMRRAEREL